MKKYLKSGKVKCPVCGGKLEVYDCTISDFAMKRISFTKLGTCHKCEKYYRWDEEFVLEGYTTPEVIEEDDEFDDLI